MICFTESYFNDKMFILAVIYWISIIIFVIIGILMEKYLKKESINIIKINKKRYKKRR